MHPIATGLVSTMLFPLYAAQGIYVRQQSLRLSPATGPRSGQFGEGEAEIRLLCIGDSSAAAVGCETTREALAPQLAEKLHARDGVSVHWHISGHNSAVAGEIRDVVVPNLEPVAYTHIVIMLGTNDLKNWHSSSRWKREFGGLLYALRTRFPETKLYWNQALDMRFVPALPQPLAGILNLRRALINRKGAQLCVERGAVCIPPLPEALPHGFARDGFHASRIGYDAWADHILAHWHHEPRTTPAARPFI